MKKKLIIVAIIIVIILGIFIGFNLKNKPNVLDLLPKPEITGGSRGELGIDKNINESTIDKYLNRSDAVYRDMRMLEDPGNYEAIGGDRYLSGYIEGFEIIPLPYILPVDGLPEGVGDTYTGTTLFYIEDGVYKPNYEESMHIIEELFPKDKVIFLMCGGGGYAGITKNFLISLGWDENKIYNVGGYWYYQGEHNVEVKKIENGVVTYDFDNLPYHDIAFESLTKVSNYHRPKNANVAVEEIKLNANKITIESGTSFKLNAIVLPNDALDKGLEWFSDNTYIATVDWDSGIVRALRPGKAKISVRTSNGVRAICEVTVAEETLKEHVILDDIFEEAHTISLYDENTLYDKYQTSPRFNEIIEDARQKRLDIVNKLVEDGKSFIFLVDSSACGSDDEVRTYQMAEEVLDNNNLPYLYLGTSDDLYIDYIDSKLNIDGYNHGSITIVKNGKIYVSLNPDIVSLKNVLETKNWLSKYIDLK